MPLLSGISLERQKQYAHSALFDPAGAGRLSFSFGAGFFLELFSLIASAAFRRSSYNVIHRQLRFRGETIFGSFADRMRLPSRAPAG
jgi:hypothetical protein